MRAPGVIAAANQAGKASGVQYVGKWQNTGWVGWQSWWTDTPIPSTGTIASQIPTAQVGDLAVVAFTMDGDGAGASWPTPSGWTSRGRYLDWNKAIWPFWKILTAPDLASRPVFSIGEGDFDGMMMVFRGCDPVTPIGASAASHYTGHGADITVNAPRAGGMLVEMFMDYSNYAGSPSISAPGQKLAYSSIIRWHATLGLYCKPVTATGVQSTGVGTWGSGHQRYVLALQPPA